MTPTAPLAPNTGVGRFSRSQPTSLTIRIHGLCVVKNESDIIEQTLRAASTWCDAIYVLDNGSTDGTWEKVLVLARELPSVIPFGQDGRRFDDGIRNVIFRHYRSCARSGDWWCILDADEIYIDNPHDFLADVPKRFHQVWQQSYNYLFTDVDLAAFESTPALFEDQVPIETRSRYYVVSDYSELRFFRHSWVLARVPLGRVGIVYPLRIRLSHYMYRSPNQIGLRLQTRRDAMQHGEFTHERRAARSTAEHLVPSPTSASELPESWKERVVPASGCHEDKGDGVYPDGAPWLPPDSPTSAARLRWWTGAIVCRVLGH